MLHLVSQVNLYIHLCPEKNSTIASTEVFHLVYQANFLWTCNDFTVSCLFCRVPCSYLNHNITIKVDENSYYPHYMAFVIWYQQGKKDITAVQLCEVSFRIFSMHSSLLCIWQLFSYQGFSTSKRKQRLSDGLEIYKVLNLSMQD